MPAVLAADCTVLELAAPGTSRLRGEHPQRAVIAENRIGVDNGVGQFVLVIAITPPDDHTIDCGVIILVDQLLTGQFLDLGADRVIHIIVPQPFLYQVAGVETEFFSVIRCRLIHVRQYTNTARTYTLRTPESPTFRDETAISACITPIPFRRTLIA